MHAVGSALSHGSFRIRDTIPFPGNNDPSNVPVVHLPGGTGEEALINWLFGALALAALVWAVSVAIRERKLEAGFAAQVTGRPAEEREEQVPSHRL